LDGSPVPVGRGVFRPAWGGAVVILGGAGQIDVPERIFDRLMLSGSLISVSTVPSDFSTERTSGAVVGTAPQSRSRPNRCPSCQAGTPMMRAVGRAIVAQPRIGRVGWVRLGDVVTAHVAGIIIIGPNNPQRRPRVYPHISLQP